MSAIWDAYESELKSLFGRIEAILDGSTSNSNSGDDFLVQMDSLLRSMDLDARSEPVQREYLLGKLKEHKSSYTSLKLKWNRWKEEHNRSALLSTTSIEQRGRLLNAVDRTNEQNEILERSIKSVEELNGMGDEIVKELQNNTTRIKSSIQKAEEMNAHLDGAQKSLKGMASREKCSIQ